MDAMDVTYRFHHYRLLPAQRQLLEAERPIKLGSRAFDTLVVLVERRDRVVTKHELIDLVWPHLVVEENNLAVHVLTLRKLLGHGAIATVPGRGYRFTLPVSMDGETPADAAAPALDTPQPVRDCPLHEPAIGRSGLLGRDNELRELQGLIDSNALVTVTGAGGIGKTRLAQGAATIRPSSWRACTWAIWRPGVSIRSKPKRTSRPLWHWPARSATCGTRAPRSRGWRTCCCSGAGLTRPPR